MSEQAPERPAPASGSRSRGGTLGLFKERIGPLPMWVWVAIIAVVLIAWRVYSNKKNASATTTADTSVPSDQVPQFINQTYTTVTAPAAAAPPADVDTPPGHAPTSTPKSNPNPPPKAGAPGMPSVKAGKATSSSIAGTWARVTGATSYHWRVTYQDKLVKQGTTSSPNVTVSGLDPDHTYTLHVASVGPGGASSETNGPGIKTTR